jgi:hypothetical protein
MPRPCSACRKHPARFKGTKGRYKSDREHDLCRRCMVALRDRVRAVRLRDEANPIEGVNRG